MQEYPFWDNAKQSAETYWRLKLSYTGPARRAVRRCCRGSPGHGHQGPPCLELPARPAPREGGPDLSHDTPNPGTAGATTFDDSFIFNGSMDRFDFKLVGKKEIVVPYNAYAAVYQAKQDDLVKPSHLNPDLVRWELHRVWVVVKLKAGKRHVYSKRTFYLDEDSWAALASDEYDARGELYRTGFAYMAPSYDLPAPYTDMFGHYDLVSRVYSLTGLSPRRAACGTSSPWASASGPPTRWRGRVSGEERSSEGHAMISRTVTVVLAACAVCAAAAALAAAARRRLSGMCWTRLRSKVRSLRRACSMAWRERATGWWRWASVATSWCPTTTASTGGRPRCP